MDPPGATAADQEQEGTARTHEVKREGRSTASTVRLLTSGKNKTSRKVVPDAELGWRFVWTRVFASRALSADPGYKSRGQVDVFGVGSARFEVKPSGAGCTVRKHWRVRG